jgi:hypothetical protein
VETYFFLVPDEHNLTQKFSKQGMQLWEKYFVRHNESSSEQENSKFLQIPPPSFLLLENNNESASPVLYALDEQSSTKRKRKDSKITLVETEVDEKEVDRKLVKRSRVTDGTKKAPGISSSAPVDVAAKINLKSGKGKAVGGGTSDKEKGDGAASGTASGDKTRLAK